MPEGIILRKHTFKVPFTYLGIGELFYADDMFWVKLSAEAGKHLCPEYSKDNYGCCSFVTDPRYEYVWQVEITATGQ